MFTRNIDGKGRRARGLTGLIFLMGAVVASFYAWWAGALLSVAAVFVFFEAARGWCLLRACGIKTKL